MISPPWGTGIRNTKKFFCEQFQTRAPDAAQRVALAKRCAAEPGPRLLAARRNRGPGSAKRHEECRIAPGTRGMQISKFKFQTAKRSRSRAAARVELLVDLPFLRGDGAPIDAP